jgi:hypothetical protein
VQAVQFVLEWDNSLGCEFLDLGLPVGFPVVNIPVSQRSQWASAPDGRLDPRIVGCINNPVPLLNAPKEGLPAAYCCLACSGYLDSTAVMKRVPTQTPLAPSTRAAATPRPSAIPPAATSVTGFPVRGDLYCLQMSAQAGTKILCKR